LSLTEFLDTTAISIYTTQNFIHPVGLIIKCMTVKSVFDTINI